MTPSNISRDRDDAEASGFFIAAIDISAWNDWYVEVDEDRLNSGVEYAWSPIHGVIHGGSGMSTIAEKWTKNIEIKYD